MTVTHSAVRDQQVKLVTTREERRMIESIAAAHERSVGDVLRLLARREYARLQSQREEGCKEY